ncbi:MAG: hypothetical protein EBT79_02470 [Actinobacteria bacterium]|nr:hypothetical protein [Actinomycetota bacterium]NBR66140.1 hypothetical protein [Actinomycetota bacterium]
MYLSIRELRVVRAALMLAVHDDSAAWVALSSDEEDLAQNLLDLIPEPITPDDDDEDEEEEEYLDDEDY